jgi:hypothetical protein
MPKKKPFRYPWDRWFSQGHFTLRYREKAGQNTFLCQPHSMSQQVRNAAVRRGLHVSIKITPDCVDVTVISKPRKRRSV